MRLGIARPSEEQGLLRLPVPSCSCCPKWGRGVLALRPLPHTVLSRPKRKERDEHPRSSRVLVWLKQSRGLEHW